MGGQGSPCSGQVTWGSYPGEDWGGGAGREIHMTQGGMTLSLVSYLLHRGHEASMQMLVH